MKTSAQTLSDGIATRAWILAQTAPDVLRQLGGPRGSATLMAQHLAEMGRFRIDPITGRPGMSQLSTLAMLYRIQDQLFNRNDWAQQTAGFDQEEVGAIIRELYARGMLASGGSDEERCRQAISALARAGAGGRDKLEASMASVGLVGRSIESLSAVDLKSLATTPEVNFQMRADDTDRLLTAFGKHKKLLSAARDIVDDTGRKDEALETGNIDNAKQLMMEFRLLITRYFNKEDSDTRRGVGLVFASGQFASDAWHELTLKKGL